MDEAAQRLLTLKTDEDTQRAAREAARRFGTTDQRTQARQTQDEGPGPTRGGRGPRPRGGGDGIPPAAQVKMLKALQEEIN